MDVFDEPKQPSGKLPMLKTINYLRRIAYRCLVALCIAAPCLASPDIPDTFDRCDDDIGGVQWGGGYTVLSSSARLRS